MADAMTAGAMMARVMVDLAAMAGATMDHEAVVLPVAGLVDRAIVVPMALVVSGADPTVLLLAAPDLAARMVVLDVDLAVPMVLVAADRIVVPALVAKADLMDAAKAVPMAVVPMVPAGVAGVVLALVVPEVLVVRAEGIWNTGWIKSTASSTKSSARLSP
jgi:hypothetical protein